MWGSCFLLRGITGWAGGSGLGAGEGRGVGNGCRSQQLAVGRGWQRAQCGWGFPGRAGIRGPKQWSWAGTGRPPFPTMTHRPGANHALAPSPVHSRQLQPGLGAGAGAGPGAPLTLGAEVQPWAPGIRVGSGTWPSAMRGVGTSSCSLFLFFLPLPLRRPWPLPLPLPFFPFRRGVLVGSGLLCWRGARRA